MGYVTDSLPGVNLNEVDDIVIELLRKITPLGALPKRQKAGSSEDEKQRYHEAQKKRQEAFEGFVLALSDQQLITGLALLIAAFSKCDISINSFTTATALSWFSCTTHLATLTVLKR